MSYLPGYGLAVLILILFIVLERTDRRQMSGRPGLHGADPRGDRDWARTQAELRANSDLDGADAPVLPEAPATKPAGVDRPGQNLTPRPRHASQQGRPRLPHRHNGSGPRAA